MYYVVLQTAVLSSLFSKLLLYSCYCVFAITHFPSQTWSSSKNKLSVPAYNTQQNSIAFFTTNNIEVKYVCIWTEVVITVFVKHLWMYNKSANFFPCAVVVWIIKGNRKKLYVRIFPGILSKSFKYNWIPLSIPFYITYVL